MCWDSNNGLRSDERWRNSNKQFVLKLGAAGSRRCNSKGHLLTVNLSLELHVNGQVQGKRGPSLRFKKP